MRRWLSVTRSGSEKLGEFIGNTVSSPLPSRFTTPLILDDFLILCPTYHTCMLFDAFCQV